MFDEAKKFHKENSLIKNLKARLNNVEGRLQFFQKNMLQKELEEIREVILNPPIRKKVG